MFHLINMQNIKYDIDTLLKESFNAGQLMVIIMEIQNHFGNSVEIKSYGDDNIETYNKIHIYINNKKIEIIIDEFIINIDTNKHYILKYNGPTLNEECYCILSECSICYQTIECYHINELLNYLYKVQNNNIV